MARYIHCKPCSALARFCDMPAASEEPAEHLRRVELTHDSLLLMRGMTQRNWVHQIPKTAKDVPDRLNLTYRVVRAKGTSAAPTRQAATRT